MFLKRLVFLVLLALAAFESGVNSQTASPGSIVNAAGFQAPVVPGSVISIFAANRGYNLIPAGEFNERTSNPES